MSSPTSRRRPAARVASILLPVIVLAGVAVFIGQSFIPLPGVSDCSVTDLVEEPGGRSGTALRIVTSCGDYYTDISRGQFQVGQAYDFELRGLFKTNIVGVTRA